jgi:hypothetical protein
LRAAQEACNKKLEPNPAPTKESAGNPHPIKDQMQKEPTAQTEGQYRQQITPTRRMKRSKEDEKRPPKVTDTKAIVSVKYKKTREVYKRRRNPPKQLGGIESSARGLQQKVRAKSSADKRQRRKIRTRSKTRCRKSRQRRPKASTASRSPRPEGRSDQKRA